MIDKSEEWLLRFRLINNKYEKLIKGWCEGDRVECGGERERETEGFICECQKIRRSWCWGIKEFRFCLLENKG